MANTLKFKRGLLAGIPTAALGEPLFTTDTFDLYIGNGTGNTKFQKFIASGATTQIIRGDGSLYTFPLAISSPSNGQVLKYNGTSWVNDSDAGITGSGSAGQVAYFTGSTTQAGEAGLTWDTTNKRLKLASTGGGQLYLEDTDATSTFNITEITNNAGNFNIATRSSAGAFVSTDYQIVKDTASSTYHRWFTAASTERMRLFNTGNFGIGTGATDSGQKLQVVGDAYIKGSGATSGTNGLVIQDSAGVNIYTFRNDGQAISTIRNAQTEASLRFTQVTANNNAGTSIPIIWYENTAASQRGVINGVWDSSNRAGFNFIHGQGTTGVSILLNNPSNQLVGGSTFTINETFNPTSGTAFRVFANIAPTINQTGGANGITYGLSVNPTLTAAADWRSITWTNNSGWGLYGQGTANNYINGGLFIGTTTTSTYKLDIVGNARVNGVSRLGSAVATNGATTIEQIYVGDQVLGVISARQGSGALLLGYGAKAKSGADGYISTFDNFSARRALLDINQGYFDFVNTAAVNTAIGS